MSLEIIPLLVPCLFETDTPASAVGDIPAAPESPAETMDGAPAGWWPAMVLYRAARASLVEVPDLEALERLSALRT
ncbi:MAG: hypothetical protein QUU85_02790, partial [Candidatus Eisenbacteria bacterium]|nr:hypothetical protein [Candidatus Eisenbacteria bacterium]